MFPYTLYPYTNFQELNLDWILQQIKGLEAAIKQLDPTVDVQAVIQEMIDNGEMANIVDETLLVDKVNRYNTHVWAVGYYSNTGNVRTMDCFVVKLYDKVLLIDAGATPTAVKHPAVDLMESLSISKVDYIYISHYHEDHVGGLGKICADIDCTGATIFLPKAPSNMYDTAQYISAYSSVISLATSNAMAIIYPNEGDSYDLTEKERIVFYNTDPSRYYGPDYVANDTSLCAALYNYDTCVWFDGDLEKAGQTYLASLVPTAIAKKMSHHGTTPAGDIEYFNAIAPRFSFATDAYGTSNDGTTSDLLSSWGYETTWLYHNAIPIYSTSAAPNYILEFEFGERLFRPLTPKYENHRISNRNTSSASIVQGYTAVAKTKTMEELLDLMAPSEYLEFNAATDWTLCPSSMRSGCFIQIFKNSSSNTQNAIADYDGVNWAYVIITPHAHGGHIQRVYKKESGSWSYTETSSPGSWMYRDGQTLSNDGTTITSQINTISGQLGDSFEISDGKLTCTDYGFYEVNLNTTNQGAVDDHYFNALYRNRSGSRTKIMQLDNNINYTGENYEYTGSNPIALNPGDTIEFDHNGTGNVWFRLMIKKIGYR